MFLIYFTSLKQFEQLVKSCELHHFGGFKATEDLSGGGLQHASLSVVLGGFLQETLKIWSNKFYSG